MKSTYNLGIMTLIGVCAFIIAVVTPETVSAQSTDSMLTNYITALNANMPPKNNPEAVIHGIGRNENTLDEALALKLIDKKANQKKALYTIVIGAEGSPKIGEPIAVEIVP